MAVSGRLTPLRFLRKAATVAFLGAAATLGSCGLFDGKAPPPPREYALHSPYPTMKTLAIAPVINQSGSRDFDPLVVSDRVFEELQQVQGVNVLPVNKTLAAMRKMGIRSINTPELAMELADTLGADGLIIASVTAYDPYEPPKIGMVMQLYAGHGMGDTTGDAPLSHVAAVFDANNQSTLVELRDFARGRTNYESAFQDRQFLADSDAYTRFVCHAMVRRLMEVERGRLSGR